MDELEQLHGLAAATDAEAVPALPEAPALDANGQPLPPPPDFNNEAAGAVDMFAAMVVGYCPKAESLWGAETKGRIAAALSPVLQKYGISFGTLPPEITLLIVAGPVLWQSSKILATQINEEKSKITEEKPNQIHAPAQTGPEVGPITQVHSQMGLYK